MQVKNKIYISLMVWIVSLIAIGSVIGNATQSDVSAWYPTLQRSSLTPPDYVFGIVWTILYAMIATSGWLIWNEKSSAELESVKKLYILQLVLNWSWMPLFFRYHLIGTSLLCILSIVALATLIIAKTYKKYTSISVLLVPYLCWLLLASYLNFYIWQYN